MLDSKAMAATLAAAIAVAVLGVGFGLMQPSTRKGDAGAPSVPAEAPDTAPGPGLRGLVPGARTGGEGP